MAHADFDDVMQEVWLELYRDNFQGALARLEAARAGHPDPRYEAYAAQIQAWLAHLTSREAYAAAYERYYARTKRLRVLKRLDRALRILLGRKTRKTIERVGRHPEVQLLEQEILRSGAVDILDAGCGEGRVALTLGARHPGLHVHGVEVTATNVRLARRMNRSPNVTFHHGLIEEVDQWFQPCAFDLAYAFGVLEHVRDVDDTVECLLKMLRPGGRCCFVVPMNEFTTRGRLPAFTPVDVAGHVRVFSEAELRKRFGDQPGFRLEKLAGEWRRDRYPAAVVPVEFGAFFVAFSKDEHRETTAVAEAR